MLPLERSNFNYILIVLTACITSLAVVCVCFLYCHSRCGCCRCKKRHNKCPSPLKDCPETVPPAVPNTRTSVVSTAENGKVSIRLNDDLDFIDERQVQLISSTTKVDSLHSPLTNV